MWLIVCVFACSIVVFRLASSEESRLMESFQALVAKLNTMALTKFHKDIEAEKTAISRQRGTRSDPQQFYTNFFLRKVCADTSRDSPLILLCVFVSCTWPWAMR